jgi:hypothetical protein
MPGKTEEFAELSFAEARRLAIFKRGAGLRERGAAFDESIILFIMYSAATG